MEQVEEVVTSPPSIPQLLSVELHLHDPDGQTFSVLNPLQKLNVPEQVDPFIWQLLEEAQSVEVLELHFGSMMAGARPAALLLPNLPDVIPMMAIVIIVTKRTKFMGRRPLYRKIDGSGERFAAWVSFKIISPNGLYLNYQA